MQESFIFYRSFYESIKNLEPIAQAEVYNAIMEYALNNKLPKNLSGIAQAIFTLIKPQIDANNRRRENGSKGGRPKKEKTETKPKHNQNETNGFKNKNLTETKPEPNVNDNVNDNDNDNKREKYKKEKVIPPKMEWVEEYCRERGGIVDANTFYDFYEAKGWKVGKERMKDWQACVRTWEKNRKPKEAEHKQQTYDFKSLEESLRA